MLSIQHIDTFYGEVQALRDVSIEIGTGDIVAIIGSNGAGKSTLMKSVIGLVHPKRGKISFNGEDISQLKASAVVSKGLVYIPEGREIFPNMTVADNLEMGAFSKSYKKQELKQHMEEAYELFPRLGERYRQKAGSLSGGEQQMLAVARGLMSDPKLLMCDEPSLGLAPVIIDEMFDALVRINREKKIPLLVVEQNAYMALSVSDTAYVLENGVVVKSGPSCDLINSPDIKKAYLGG